MQGILVLLCKENDNISPNMILISFKYPDISNIQICGIIHVEQ